MGTRNFLLELIEGERTYIPPPNHCIVELLDMEKTKGGIITPLGESPGGQMSPVGKVRERGTCIGEHWEEPPCWVGDYIQFSPQLGLITDIHDGWCVVPYDCVNLIIRPGKHAHEGLVHEPTDEKPTTLNIVPHGLDADLTL
jgi:hypothetical protein